MSWEIPREKGPIPRPGRRSRTMAPMAVPSQRRLVLCDITKLGLFGVWFSFFFFFFFFCFRKPPLLSQKNRTGVGCLNTNSSVGSEWDSFFYFWLLRSARNIKYVNISGSGFLWTTLLGPVVSKIKSSFRKLKKMYGYFRFFFFSHSKFQEFKIIYTKNLFKKL